MKFIFQIYLRSLAGIILKKFKPTVIVVCGSTNKSTLIEIAASSFSGQTEIAASPRNFNAEIGVPLSILRIVPRGDGKLERWSRTALLALKQIFKLKNYPKFILLEFGMHTPKDAEALLKIAVPDVCVFTNLAPSILSHADKSEQYRQTFSYFLRRIPKETILVTNADDPHLEELRSYFPDTVLRFGQDKSADWILTDLKDNELGQQFTLINGQNFYDIKLKEFGVHQAYIRAAVLALAGALKLDPTNAAKCLNKQ